MDRMKELPTMQARLALGEHLRSLRTAQGWTEEILQELAGVSMATIRSIENAYKGRIPRKRTLILLSQAFNEPDDYFQDYLSNAAAKEPATETEGIKVPPPRSRWDLIAQRLDKIVVDRLEEMVVPRLENVESQVRAIADIIHNPSREVETYGKHPGDGK